MNRSWGILEAADDAASRSQAYGSKFNYAEFLSVSGGPLVAFLGSLAFVAALAPRALPPLFTVILLSSRLTPPFAVLIAPFRWLIKKIVTKAGDGPSPEAQKNGWYEVTTIAKSDDGRKEVKVVGKGKGDPGYAATAVLISSSALCLLKDHDRLPPLAQQGGFLTPATAFGQVLVERLERTGRFSWSVEDSESAKDK